MLVETSEEHIHNQFVYIAHELSLRFPELDLSFNFQSGSGILRCLIADCSFKVFELTLGVKQTEELLYDAIFTLKQAFALFDA